MLINPYVFGGLWTPAQITTALWLDAADSGTVTTVSGAVSQWSDKSGNGRNMGQSNNAQRPTYTLNGQNGRNVLTFDGANDWMELASDLLLGTQHTLYIVANSTNLITATGSYQALAGGGSWASPSTTTSGMYLYGGPSTSFMTNERLSYIVTANNGTNGGGVYGYGKADQDVSGAFIVGLGFTTTGNAFSGRFNGSSDFATVVSTGGFTSTNTRYPTVVRRIASVDLSTDFWNGYICEIVVSTSYLSVSSMQLVEGYLAHKWGLAAKLPSNHPYKSSAPMI